MKPLTENLLQIALSLFILDWVLININAGLRLIVKQLEQQEKSYRTGYLIFVCSVCFIAFISSNFLISIRP
jgi:hypothetical protein